MKNVTSYFLLIALSLVYFLAGYILGFYQGNLSAYKDSAHQINQYFEDPN